MKFKKFALIFILGICFISHCCPQEISKKLIDKNAIKSMTGCYQVTFEYGETVSPEKDYKFFDNYYSKGTEWAEVIEETENKIVIQHILVFDTFGMKHWRQDWIFEGKDVLDYTGNNTWLKKQLLSADTKGQWTQKVFQVDDSPRYEANGTWIHADGRHYWESTANSPLPRREFSKRSDYNILKRRNRHEVTEYGWVHEQDNTKILKNTDGAEKIISEEKGWNKYKTLEDSKCKTAKEWWAKNQNKWNEIRNYIDLNLANAKEVYLESKVENLPMYLYIDTYKQKEIKDIIDLFLKIK
ncbi:MAG TPA: hypothetical protein PKD85_06410 [Saprospiraceae bacterium]|nr:hypothetical protein [Saprospiraceae bacterium]